MEEEKENGGNNGHFIVASQPPNCAAGANIREDSFLFDMIKDAKICPILTEQILEDLVLCRLHRTQFCIVPSQNCVL